MILSQMDPIMIRSRKSIFKIFCNSLVLLLQSGTKKRDLLKNPTKIEEIQETNLLTEIEPLQLAF